MVELKNSNVPSDSLQLMKFNASLEYNFLIKNYERYLSNNENILETALPYFYDVLSDSVLLESYKGFEGTSFYEQPSKIITSNFINEYITNIIPSEVIIDNKKLEISKYLEKFNSFKEQFPFYADIKFSTHPLGKMSITKAIQDKNLFPELFETIAKDSVQSTLFFKNEQNNSKLNVREMDITQFLNKKLDYFSDNDFTFIFDINQRVDNKARSFSEILLNKGEYAEVIGYHLKKFQGDTSNLIQEWYLPNTDEVDFNWVDTQIKYDKKYTYKLDLIVLSFATEYMISNVELSTNRVSLEFINRPLIKTYILSNVVDSSQQTIGATYTNFLMDYPPIEPEVEFVPYIEESEYINKIKPDIKIIKGSNLAKISHTLTCHKINFESNYSTPI